MPMRLISRHTRSAAVALLAFTLNTLCFAATFHRVKVPGSVTTETWGINNKFQIVGVYVDSHQKSHGFLLSGGVYKALNFPQASGTSANGINDSGEIVGSFTSGTGIHGFMRVHGVYTQLDYPGSVQTLALGVNATGQIVGTYCTQSSCSSFKYDHGVWTNVQIPGAISTNASGINKHGDIVGSYQTSPTTIHGFVLHPDMTYTTIDYPGHVGRTVVEGIDDNGDVIGGYSLYIGGGRGFLLHAGQYTHFLYPNTTFTTGYGINNKLYGVGIGWTDNGPTKGFYVKLP